MAKDPGEDAEAKSQAEWTCANNQDAQRWPRSQKEALVALNHRELRIFIIFHSKNHTSLTAFSSPPFSPLSLASAISLYPVMRPFWCNNQNKLFLLDLRVKLKG